MITTQVIDVETTAIIIETLVHKVERKDRRAWRLTYSTVDPDSDRKIVSRLSTSRTDDVQGQTVLRDGILEGRGVGTVTIADVAILRSIARLIPRFVDGLRRRKAKRASGRLSIRDTEEELLVVVLVAHAMICPVAEIDGGGASQIVRVRGSIAG